MPAPPHHTISNGLVRHYYMRRGPNMADLQINLLPKDRRKLQSHEIAKQVRERLVPVANRYGRASRWPSSPRPAGAPNPGGRGLRPAQGERIRHRAPHSRSLEAHHGVVDVDWYVGALPE